MRRVFLALSLSQSAKGRIALEKQRAEGFSMRPPRWISADSWHLTLHFLGAQKEETLGRLIEELLRLEGLSKGEINLDTWVAFPSSSKATVLALGAREVPQGLATLVSQTGAVLEKLSIPLESRPFRPHVTVARWRAPVRLKPFPEVSPIKIVFDAFHLYESQTLPAGSKYKILETFPLP